MNLKPIHIAGGGLAGLTLGIGLRLRGIPVTVWEAGHYPRHRVCGEFVSGRGQLVLERLGLLLDLYRAGASHASTVVFFLGRSRSPLLPVTPPALCFSRFKLDSFLATRFRDLGGELHERQRWTTDRFGEGVVRATGRKVQPIENGWRWFGLKAHARDLPLIADLELHSFAQGYVGLCRLQNGIVNVCGLFRRPALGLHNGDSATPFSLAPGSALPASSKSPAERLWAEVLRASAGVSLHEQLRNASFDPASFRSVAGLPLSPQRAGERAECCLGDALTMIAPVTGNGMSMAFEAAELAIDPIAAYSQRRINWAQARETIAHACDCAFARRLAWGDWLQRLLFCAPVRSRPTCLALHSAWVWHLLFSRTR